MFKKAACIFRGSHFMALAFLIVALGFAAGTASAEGETTVTDATGAYAYNPNPPFEVVALVSGDTVPTGWGVYLEDDNAALSLVTPTGQTVNLSGKGFFTTAGIASNPTPAMGAMIATKAAVVKQSNQVVQGTTSEEEDSSADQESLDEPDTTSPSS